MRSINAGTGKSEKASIKAESVLHNEAQKCINFKQMLQEYRDRSEYNMPYTIMQVEDVMFVDDNTIVALEYVFYSKEGKYHKIKRDYTVSSEGQNITSTFNIKSNKAKNKEKVPHYFGTESYMKDIAK